MTANETALREYRAALEQLASILKTAKIRAERDDTPPVLAFYLGLADNLVSRLHFLSNYIDAPPAGEDVALRQQEEPAGSWEKERAMTMARLLEAKALRQQEEPA